MKRRVLLISSTVGVAVLVTFLYARGNAQDTAEPVTAAVSRGSIVRTVSATGTMQAMTTVQVGTQVSGVIESLHADFNSIVRKGQVLARLEPSLIGSEIVQRQAGLTGAQADLDRQRVALLDARTKLSRAEQLWERQLIARTELDVAQVAVSTAAASIRSNEAQVAQARATLNQSRVNLGKTVITSPIDGFVIARNVDVGQTVAASLSAPVLFVIAADLSQMQVNASIDESDLANVDAGMAVQFTVDAYSGETFRGTVTQIRLSPTVVQNVVSYTAIVAAPNAELKLKPGMTANLTIETARLDDVLRVPAAALRYQPQKGQDAVWVKSGAGVTRVEIVAGQTDGSFVEVKSGPLAEGALVITRAAAAAGATGNPLLGNTGPRR